MRQGFRDCFSVSAISLFEVAIVLAVVGLLTAGVMKGYELLKQARLQKTVSQILSVQSSVRLFRDRYSAWPGDFSDATSLWGHCTRNGNGDGVVDGDPFLAWSEASLFWQHLDLGGLSAGLNFMQGYDTRQTHGQFWPVMPIGCLLLVQSNPLSLEGCWLMLTSPRGLQKYLTPAEAVFVDRQIDNGHPLSGQVRSMDAPGCVPGSCVHAGRYNLKSKKPACVVYILLDD
jgi:hypothetical protein